MEEIEENKPPEYATDYSQGYTVSMGSSYSYYWSSYSNSTILYDFVLPVGEGIKNYGF